MLVMLAKVFLGLIIMFILFISFFIVKIAIPMYRFMSKADLAIDLYPFFEEILTTDTFKKEIEVKCGENTLNFSTPEEASIEYEKLIKEALEHYDKLEYFFNMVDDLRAKKDRLITICSEVRTIRWERQK